MLFFLSIYLIHVKTVSMYFFNSSRYDNMARGSNITTEVLIRRLHGFCQMHYMTPMQLADLGIKDVKTFRPARRSCYHDGR